MVVIGGTRHPDELQERGERIFPPQRLHYLGLATLFRTFFSETEACLPELDRAHVSQRRVHPLLVVPPHVVVQLQLEIAQARELLPVHELGFQRLVGRLVDGVVERAALLRERPGYAENLEELVERRVVELRSPVGMEHVYVEQREREGRERGLDQIGVLLGPCGVPHNLAVVQVYDQAYVAPRAEHAHVGEVADHVGVRCVAVELAREHVGQLRLVRPVRARLELRLRVAAGQAPLLHDPADPPAAGDDLALGQRPLYAPGAVAPAALVELLLDRIGDRVLVARVPGLVPEPVVRRPGHA